MKLITKADMIRGVSERWSDSYRSVIRLADGRSSADVQSALNALGEDATEADVTAVIGNDLWCALKCDECSERVDAVIQVGEEPDYGSHTASLCKSCARKAMEAFR